MNNYTPEQVDDITAREKEVLAFLKEKQMCPSAKVAKVNMGEDVFADKVIPYLADMKYVLKDGVYIEAETKDVTA